MTDILSSILNRPKPPLPTPSGIHRNPKCGGSKWTLEPFVPLAEEKSTATSIPKTAVPPPAEQNKTVPKRQKLNRDLDPEAKQRHLAALRAANRWESSSSDEMSKALIAIQANNSSQSTSASSTSTASFQPSPPCAVPKKPKRPEARGPIGQAAAMKLAKEVQFESRQKVPKVEKQPAGASSRNVSAAKEKQLPASQYQVIGGVAQPLAKKPEMQKKRSGDVRDRTARQQPPAPNFGDDWNEDDLDFIDDGDVDGDWRSQLRQITGYNPAEFRGRDGDVEVADGRQIALEESRSAKIAAREDAEELRRIQEEEKKDKNKRRRLLED